MPRFHPIRRALPILFACLAGCGGEVRFAPDELLRATAELTDEQSAAIDATLAVWFGTPDEPQLPKGLPRLEEILDLATLDQAAGPVASHSPGVTHGLYRRHCARCHGVTGDGRGPTALYQDPYPRDFRLGVFKWKSTRRASPPTRTDLDTLLEHGVPGTAMPSFVLLSSTEREALRQYVYYLVLRGQAERALVQFTSEELPPEKSVDLSDQALKEELLSRLAEIVLNWVEANEEVILPSEMLASNVSPEQRLARGKELYHSDSAGCGKCHGAAGRGGAVAGVDYEIDYDLWARDQLLPPKSKAFKAAVAKQLPARSSRPRGIVGEALRGGAQPVDLFRRLHQGIAGTPMPALGGRLAEETATLTDDEIQMIVEYVLTLTPEIKTSDDDQLVGSRP